ncbi:MAG: SemiSWEET transporter [Motiliproteus sp.]
MDTTTNLGLAAAFCTTASFIPQVLQILKTGNVDGISISMYSIFTTGIALWLAYGLALHDLPIIIANAITLLLCLVVLRLTIKHRLNEAAKTPPQE